jgi:Kef-type K+ transport system membrane component KefB
MLVGIPVVILFGVLSVGSHLPTPAGTGILANAKAVSHATPLILLTLQVVVILVVARLVGGVFRRFGQPRVVGEMLAGILLGPSVLGWVWPDLSSALFAPSSLGSLNAVSQVGLLVFMFLVGLEFDGKMLAGQRGAALIVSHVSISTPFILGAAVAYWLFPRFAPPGTEFVGFALFMGAAMSVTAFPVLARILMETRLTTTPLGALALACAAVDDVTAWAILAGAVLVVRATGDASSVWMMIAGSVVYLGVMFYVVKPLVRRLGARLAANDSHGEDWLAATIVLALVSAMATEWLGLHALFGAFIAGVVMPKDYELAHALRSRLESFTLVLLLPLFFALAGLRTEIGALGSWDLGLTCALLVAVAVTGKLGGTFVAARASGVGWRDAGALGILMNTRGLMELVILNVGLEIGVLSKTLFTMMVIMAVVTTIMTTPLLRLIRPDLKKAGVHTGRRSEQVVAVGPSASS